MSGATSYHSGLAAEGQVAAYYQANNHSIAARRWRGISGEIDLILRHRATVVLRRSETRKKFRTRRRTAWPGADAKDMEQRERISCGRTCGTRYRCAF